MKLSEIKEGIYYSKNDDPSWLRYVVNIDGYRVIYVEWLGWRVCRIQTIADFAAKRLTPQEAAEQSPKEFAKIAKFLEKDPGFAVGNFDYAKWRPGDLSHVIWGGPHAAAMANVSNEELKWLWLCLERLQKDTQPGGAWGIWNEKERAALVTVMDAVKETYSEPL